MSNSIADRMVVNLFNDDFSYMDYKLTPVLAECAEAKSKAAIEVSKAQAKQVELTTTIDAFKQFASAAKQINELPNDLGIDKQKLIQELMKKVDISQ